MSTTPPSQPAPQTAPPPQFTISATPDGKYATIAVTVFVELANAEQIGQAIYSMAKQLQSHLVLPPSQNGRYTPPSN